LAAATAAHPEKAYSCSLVIPARKRSVAISSRRSRGTPEMGRARIDIYEGPFPGSDLEEIHRAAARHPETAGEDSQSTGRGKGALCAKLRAAAGDCYSCSMRI